jgi:hypothetical protein
VVLIWAFSVRIPSECYMAPEDSVENVIGRVSRGHDLEREERRE